MCVYIYIYMCVYLYWTPRWYSGTESACQFRRYRRLGFQSRVGKISWKRKWQPTPAFLPRKSHGQGSLVGCSPWGHKESDTTAHERARHIYFGCTVGHVELPRPGIEPMPLQWKHGVLTTGPPGKLWRVCINILLEYLEYLSLLYHQIQFICCHQYTELV